MKSLTIILVILSTYCYCEEQLVGGWSKSTDEELNKDCLKLALNKIHDAKVGDDVQSQVFDHACITQIVNGLNIKCDFVLRGQRWHCSYYKPFVNPIGIQLDGCTKVGDDDQQDDQRVPQSHASNVNEVNDEEQMDTGNEQKSNEHDDEEAEQAVPKSETLNENELDEEGQIDAMSKKLAQEDANDEQEEEPNSQ